MKVKPSIFFLAWIQTELQLSLKIWNSFILSVKF